MALTISPGPDIIYVLLQSIVNGKKYGIATSAGLISGILVHTTLVAFGVSAIIKQSDVLFTIIKVLGAVYLFYLAYKVFKSNASIELGNEATPKKDVVSLFKQGFIMNVLNPKVSIFFLAFFPGFLFSKSLSSVTQFYVLGVIFMLQAFLIFAAVSVLSGSISTYIKGNNRVGVWLKWLQIVVFVGIGLFILLAKK
jgi:threonine/homoserine/homoserine lactone efflux protein